jgi:hypothetical protein
MIRKIIPIVAVVALSNGLFGQSALQSQQSQKVEEAREKIQKWVETRQAISKERTEWKVQKETLEATRDLLNVELADLEGKIADLEGNESAADQRRAELTEEKNGLDAATASVRSTIADLELKLKQMVPYFPPAFAQQIDPLLRRMPEDPYNPGRISLGERLPNIVGILQSASKYNSTIHSYVDTVSVGGQELQVDVLYWGMAIAYFVDRNNTYSGYKVPSADGWKTIEVPEIAESVRNLVDMYSRANPNIQFLEVPVVIN